jgi:type II secretory pathway component PulF
MARPLGNVTHRHRLLRLAAATLAFVTGATVLIVLVVRAYLLPAYEAWRQAGPHQRALLSASSTLLLAVMLLVLLLLLTAAFGVRRYFHRSAERHRVRTRHTDAWAESARRARPPES